jgi:GH18 family chitinase
MGVSADYQNVEQWQRGTQYTSPARVKHNGNIFDLSFGQNETYEPAVGDAAHNGWRFYDELYDQTSVAPTDQAKVIAYIPCWRQKEGFNYSNDEIYRYITHGIVAFLTFSETTLGEFDSTSIEDVNAILSDVVNTGHRNGTRISIALGGANDYGFLALMTSVGNDPASPLLDHAVQNVVNFVTSNNLDGVDLDLECWWGKPGERDQGGRETAAGPHPAGSALMLFAQRLKQAMPGRLVSAAVFGTSWYGNNYDPKIADHVDWLGVMTYDLTGSWNATPVGPHTGLSKIRNQDAYAGEQQGEWPGNGPKDNPILSVEDALWCWTNPFFVTWNGAGHKIPRNKIAGGVPLFGYDFAYGKEPDDVTKQVPPGYKVIRYKHLLTDFPDAYRVANGNIKVSGVTPRPPFISAPGSYPYANNIYFETPDTAVAKLKFLRSVGVQGVIIWDLCSDVWEEGKSIVKALYRNSGNPPREVGAVSAPVSVGPLVHVGTTVGQRIPFTTSAGPIGYRGIPRPTRGVNPAEGVPGRRPSTGVAEAEPRAEPEWTSFDMDEAGYAQAAEDSWRGVYVAQSAGEAAGYVGPESGSGPGDLWQVSSRGPLNAFRVQGIGPAEEAANQVRALMNAAGIAIEPGQGVLEVLGANQLAYMGPLVVEGGEVLTEEIALSPAFAAERLEARSIATTTFRGGTSGAWFDMSTPANQIIPQGGDISQLGTRFPNAQWPALQAVEPVESPPIFPGTPVQHAHPIQVEISVNVAVLTVVFRISDQGINMPVFTGNTTPLPIIGYSGVGVANLNYDVEWLVNQHWEATFDFTYGPAGTTVRLWGLSGEDIGSITSSTSTGVIPGNSKGRGRFSPI